MSTSTLSVDPGLHVCGVALWWGPWLLRAAAVHRPSSAPSSGPGAWAALAREVRAWVGEATPGEVVVETMRYDHQGKGAAVDLLQVQGVAGAVAGAFAVDGWVGVDAPAHEWKRQVPRNIMGQRVEAWLRARGDWPKVAVPSRATHLNDVMHAVGVGKWRLRL